MIKLSEIKEKRGPEILLWSFYLFNASKLTVFNFILMPDQSAGTFLIKLMYSLLLNLVVLSLIIKFRSRTLFISSYIIQSLYIFANLSYFSYFNNYLHMFQASALFTEGLGQLAHFTIPVNASMLIIILDLPLFISLMLRYEQMDSMFKARSYRLVRLAALAAVFLICLECWNYKQGEALVQLSDDFYSSETKIIEKYGTFANNSVDFIVNYGGENLIEHFEYGDTVEVEGKNSTRSNIIAVQIESMDSNIVGQVYKGKPVMPYLSSLSSENLYFPYTLSYHKSGGTSDSEFSIINSIEPLGNFPSIKIPKYDYPNSLVKVLGTKGYSTRAIHGNVGNYYNRDKAFKKMGFDEFNDLEDIEHEDRGWGASDDEVFSFALNKLKTQKLPFFYYIITLSSHMPFNYAEEYYVNDEYADIEDDTVRGYFNSMSYVDSALKDFVEQVLREYPNTYVFIWGDHAPEINCEEYTQASYEVNDDYFEFVPLVVITPDGQKHREEKRIASFLDISPTILNASGIGFTIMTDGQNLLRSPVEAGKVPLREDMYDRAQMYDKASQTSVKMIE